jgi:hypothetical protein
MTKKIGGKIFWEPGDDDFTPPPDEELEAARRTFAEYDRRMKEKHAAGVVDRPLPDRFGAGDFEGTEFQDEVRREAAKRGRIIEHPDDE